MIPHNAASIRVLEKTGFREEGLARRYLRIAGGVSGMTTYSYAVTAEEWPPSADAGLALNTELQSRANPPERGQPKARRPNL